MIATMDDVRTFRSLFDEAREILRKEERSFAGQLEEGIMIETPSAAVMSEHLLGQVDFANIGSNDLTQFTLAASRGNPLVEKRYHILPHSVVKLLEMVAEAGRKHGKEVCLCGEVSAFEEFYPLFLASGLRSFSVAASKLMDIKCHLPHIETGDCGPLLEEFYSADSKKSLDGFFRRLHHEPGKNGGAGPFPQDRP
jgi:phosphotransferase system enzyme I (PtsI)